MQAQNFENHRKFTPDTLSHKMYYLSIAGLTVLAIANLVRALMISSGRISAVLFISTSLSFIYAFFTFRSFSLRAQDRAIRAEENLRHFALTGKLLNKELRMSQIIALRFAPDEEFIALAERAVKENLKNIDIKKAIQNWKADHHRA